MIVCRYCGVELHVYVLPEDPGDPYPDWHAGDTVWAEYDREDPRPWLSCGHDDVQRHEPRAVIVEVGPLLDLERELR